MVGVYSSGHKLKSGLGVGEVTLFSFSMLSLILSTASFYLVAESEFAQWVHCFSYFSLGEYVGKDGL